MLRAAARGALVGIGWGVLARVFMRLFATTPEFSWAGTLMIVGLSTTLWAGIALVDRARVTGRSRWWRLAPLPGVVLFMGPGLVLVPGVVGVALWRALRSRMLGWLSLVLGLGAVTFAILPGDPSIDLSDVPVSAWFGLALLLAATVVLGLGVHAWAQRWGPDRARTPVAPEAGPTAYGPRGRTAVGGGA